MNRSQAASSTTRSRTFQQATETLKSRGVRFIGEPHIIHSTDTYDLWMSFFTDPDGNTLALMAEVPR